MSDKRTPEPGAQASGLWATIRSHVSGLLSRRSNRARDIREIWRRTWFALNELAAHFSIVVAIVLVMAGLEYTNLVIDPPNGVMVLDMPAAHLPLKWFFGLVDAGALSRAMLAGFRIFRYL